jgi:hypothetical protein
VKSRKERLAWAKRFPNIAVDGKERARCFNCSSWRL